MFRSKQLSLSDVYADCLDTFDNDKPGFLSMLEQNIDIDALIPLSFRQRFYAWTGRPREYPLTGFIWSLVIHAFSAYPRTACSSFSCASQRSCANSADSPRFLTHPSSRASSKAFFRISGICSTGLLISLSPSVLKSIRSSPP